MGSKVGAAGRALRKRPWQYIPAVAIYIEHTRKPTNALLACTNSSEPRIRNCLPLMLGALLEHSFPLNKHDRQSVCVFCRQLRGWL
eukprot:1185320-Pleurochrysis_carterae.AAC.2